MSFLNAETTEITTDNIQITYRQITETMQKPHTDIDIINVRLPKGLISILDSLVEKNLFSSRSEAIREFSREYVLEQRIQNRVK